MLGHQIVYIVNIVYLQHNIIDSQLFESSIRARSTRQRAETWNEETLVPPTREPTNAKTKTNHHHRRLDSVHGVQTDNAIDESTYSHTEFDRRASAFRWRERRIFSNVWSEESAMMTNTLQLAHSATKLKIAKHKLIIATIFIVNKIQ